MNKRFIEYLEYKIEDLAEEIESLEAQVDNLEKYGIDLKEYGGRYEAKRIYNAYHGTPESSLGKAFNITTKKDLEEFIKRRELKKLYKQIGKLNQGVLSLKRAIKYYAEDRFTEEIYPNDEVVRSIYEAGSNGILTNEEMIRLLASLCKNLNISNRRTDEVLSTELSIARDFDDNLAIKVAANREKLGLYFSKLVIAVQTEPNREIFLKNAELKELIKELDTKKEPKILVPNIDKDGNIVQDPKVNEILERVLGQDQIKLILKGYDLLDKTKDENVRKLLLRVIKNVISQSIYIDLIRDELRDHANMDILLERIAILRDVVTSLTQKDIKRNSFIYQKNEDGLPKILDDIQTIDPLAYTVVYKMLDSLAKGNYETKRGSNVRVDPKKLRCELVKTENGIDFYAISLKGRSIIFSIVDGRILIHRLCNALPNEIKQKITDTEIYSAMEYQGSEISDVIESLSEEMVIETLDLKDQVEEKTFQRRK